MQRIKLSFYDKVIVLPAYISEQFYLFDGGKSLTVFLPVTDEVDKIIAENAEKHLHFCCWDTYVSPSGMKYYDMTIDFLVQPISISIIDDESEGWINEQNNEW
jgi:hypothetical protein